MTRQQTLQVTQQILSRLQTRRKNPAYREIQHDLNLIAEELMKGGR